MSNSSCWGGGSVVLLLTLSLSQHDELAPTKYQLTVTVHVQLNYL